MNASPRYSRPAKVSFSIARSTDPVVRICNFRRVGRHRLRSSARGSVGWQGSAGCSGEVAGFADRGCPRQAVRGEMAGDGDERQNGSSEARSTSTTVGG